MKSILKGMANGLALLLVLPFFLAYRGGCLVLGGRAFPGWSQFFSLVPGLAGVYLRRAFYRLALSRCGNDACLSFGTIFSHSTAEVGRRVYVGAFCCLGDVTLEDDVLLGSQVSIVNGGNQHGIDRLDIPIREQTGIFPRLTVGRDSWIGERAVVMAGVGRHCVVAAGSVVTGPVPDFAIVAGVPARIIRFRNDPDSSLLPHESPAGLSPRDLEYPTRSYPQIAQINTD